MAQQNQQNTQPSQTIEITNFGGRLTRKLNGDMNSGFANFTQSWGYDPFSKPDNLTWLEQPSSILSSTTNLIVAAKPRFEGGASGTQQVYAIGSGGTLYKIQPSNNGNPNNPNYDNVTTVGSVLSNAATYNYGASMDFFGVTEKIYVGNDSQINSINFDGTADAVVGNTNNYTSGGHQLKQFVGKLLFANGNTFGGINGNTQTVTSSVIGTGQGNLYSELLTPLGIEAIIHDLDVSVDGNQLLASASNICNEDLAVANDDRISASSSDGYINMWNGSDNVITAQNTIPSYAITSLQAYIGGNYIFSNDAFGASVNDGNNKILSLPNNKSPLPNATLINGNFLSWVAPELTTDGTTLQASMYYFGSLDQENPPGLYRVMVYKTTLSGGAIYQVPVNILTNNKYSTLNSNKSAVSTFGYGKHYISVWDLNNSTNSYRLLSFLITPTGTGTPQLGVYQTQTQLFSKKITAKQIRVYTEPTASNNGFQIDCIGSDGNVITNGTFNYTYAAGSDPTLLQGALQRIDFNPKMADQYALGLRITNTGTANMTIKKIEVDWAYSGK
jgi:hypothetical protein